MARRLSDWFRFVDVPMVLEDDAMVRDVAYGSLIRVGDRVFSMSDDVCLRVCELVSILPSCCCFRLIQIPSHSHQIPSHHIVFGCIRILYESVCDGGVLELSRSLRIPQIHHRLGYLVCGVVLVSFRFRVLVVVLVGLDHHHRQMVVGLGRFRSSLIR